MIILLIISMLSPIHPFPSKTYCKNNIPNLMLYTNQTQECWSQGKVLFYNRDNIFYPTFTCHPLHSSSPCDQVGRLVFSGSPCAETVCRAYKEKVDSPCPYPFVSYNESECAACIQTSSGEICEYDACGSILGRRLVPDVFGDYSCLCDRGIGFVEYAGSCHAEYLQGPCKKGEQLMVREEGAECVMNNFKKGEAIYELPSALMDKLTNRELAYFWKMDFGEAYEKLCGRDSVGCMDPRSRESFDNCHNKDTNGMCLATTKLPIVHKHNYLKNFKQLFPEFSKSMIMKSTLDLVDLVDLKL